jgi:GNAT superfamily N-acetyltransferase
MAAPITLERVIGSGQFRRFVAVPRELHAGTTGFSSPLDSEQLDRLHRTRNPWFRRGELAAWIAWRDGKPVGRVSAQIDRRGRPAGGSPGSFGFFDSQDDDEVAARLLTEAETWLRERGVSSILGPLSPSINTECGVLVDGFEAAPMVLMPWNPRYIPALIERAGYRKGSDLLAYRIDLEDAAGGALGRMRDFRSGGRLRTRPVDLSRIEAETALIVDLFNDAWQDNYGFAPLEVEELAHAIRELRLFVVGECGTIVELDGTPIAFALVVPNIAELYAPLNGRLLPFGWMRLLVGALRRRYEWGRVVMLGVRREYQRSVLAAGASSAIMARLHDLGRRYGIRHVELSWVLETNHPMRRMAEALGASAYKTYRLYEKSLVA